MINFEFIKKLEGYELNGYVPDPENSKSGVTIASGFDLGHRSPAELSSAFETSLAEKLTPYTGKIKQDAVAFLAENPLTVTNDEATTINKFAHSNAVNRLEREWDSNSNVSGALQ